MAQIAHADVGDTWTPQATFKVAGVNTDPTTITVKVREPDGTITTLGPVSGATGGGGIVRVSAGIFNTVISLDASGYWAANFTGTGAAAASEDHELRVDPSLFSTNGGLDDRALVGLQETKDWLQAQNIDTGEDLDLVRVINDISNRFHEEAGREFKAVGTNPQTRTFDVDGAGWNTGVVDVGDVTSITSVDVLSSDWTTVLQTVPSTDYAALPLNRAAWEPIRRLYFNYGLGVPRLRGGYRVRVTGTFGFPAVPGNVRQAVLDAIAATMDRDVEHYRQDLAARSDAAGGTILQVTQAPMFLSMPPGSLAVAWSYRDPLVG